ncbi:phosphopantetheine-binding protein [Streptomyces sp. BH055]|uniref:phosphopantetheine-binding protein n=1 Tax=Streptomyces sp. BH055 TaxID=3401173 RepID=UPI003BB7B175
MNDKGSAGPASTDTGDLDIAGHEVLRAHVRAQWSEALGHDRFGDDDEFFDVGGHSLLIADIMARLGALADTRLSLRLFFDHPTVNELTEALSADGSFEALTR